MVAQPKYNAKNELRPFIPLIIGQGKLARHIVYYLSSLSIPFQHWPNSRDLKDPAFKPLLSDVTLVWILVSDRAIAEIASAVHELSPELPLMHSSATTEVPSALTLHPLQTFGPELYQVETYTKVPMMFVSEEWEKAPALKQSIETVFPNPKFEIPNAKRALYHAYCVMIANFPQLLWGWVEDEAEGLVNNPEALFAPILKKTSENFLAFGKKAVTGPLVRGDTKTLELHLNALKGSKLFPIYENFVQAVSKKPSQEPQYDHRSGI